MSMLMRQNTQHYDFPCYRSKSDSESDSVLIPQICSSRFSRVS